MRRAAALALALVLAVACGGGSAHDPDAAAPPPPDATPAEPDATPLPDPCAELGLASRPFSEGPYGTHRGDVAEDFSLELLGGATFSFRDRWSGCDSYIFVPDTLRNSDSDPTSVWARDVDLLMLLSPKNVHYFFVSRAGTDGEADAATAAMAARIEAALGSVPAGDAAHWRERLHVVRPRAGAIAGWTGDLLGASGIGRLGFAIDRQQRIRGVGMLADVYRYTGVGDWPFESNLAYASYEARYMNAQSDLAARLEGETATVVTLFSGEVLAELAEVDATLPTAAEVAAFDTLEIEITQACPNPDAVEFGNCGSWDYLAYLFVQDEAGANVELARFITSYHRETHWVVDATPMLPLLRDGGMRHFRWEFATNWNPQPTATHLSLRFSTRGGRPIPAETTFLFGGGAFNSAYNDGRAPVDVAIPADAARVELVAIVTGHGNGTNSCAEFCNHQHEVTVNGVSHLRAHPSAATTGGCIDEVDRLMTPNQGGTWWYGRGGWCPGQQVDPWVVDVTADVTPGAVATVAYRGLYNGVTPPDGAGDIFLSSYLVVYR